jgi:nitroreductase
MSDIIKAIKNRRAIRKYKNQQVEKEKLDAILKSALFAPSARHTRAFELIVVANREKIKKLGDMKPHSAHVGQAPAVIVVCSKDWQYWLEDASIIAQHIWLEAVNQGLSSCWTQVRDSHASDGSDPEEYVRKILEIPKHIRVLCLMPIGYADEQIAPHMEKNVEKEKIHHNKW